MLLIVYRYFCYLCNSYIIINIFFAYVKHVSISDTDTEGYYDDILLHEVMHFCGGDGRSVLKEGINELFIRKILFAYEKVFWHNRCCKKDIVL